MSPSNDRGSMQRERELDLSRLALHLREAARAARRLGFSELYNLTLPSLMSLRGATAGVESVPALKLTETELAERLPLRELVEHVTAELFQS